MADRVSSLTVSPYRPCLLSDRVSFSSLTVSPLRPCLLLQRDNQPGVTVLLDFNTRDDREHVVQTLLAERPQLTPPDDRLQARLAPALT